MQSGREDTLEERYEIKFGFKLGKNATETYGMLQTAIGECCMDRISVFEWHKRFKEGRESVTVPQPPNSRDLDPCDFRLFPKFRGCRYETIEELS